MKELYYIYNNEAIASCILISILNEEKEVDIARCCLALPFLLDDRIINYLESEIVDKELNLQQFVNTHPKIFASFNKRFLSLLPVTVNSIVLLNKTNQIYIKGKIIHNNISLDLDRSLSERLSKIKKVIPYYLRVTSSHPTEQLYNIFKVHL